MSTQTRGSGRISQQDSAGNSLAEIVVLLKQISENQKALIQQQKIHNAHLIRQELRAATPRGSSWIPLPPVNGEPFPFGIDFPENSIAVSSLPGDELDALLLAYGLSTDHFNSVKLYRNDMDKRGVLSRFIQGTYKSV